MAEGMTGLKRTSLCAEIDQAAFGREMTLMGWCHKQRNLGGLIFITLRDRSGEIQLLIDENCSDDLRAKAAEVRSEYVIAVRGILQKRSAPNPDMPTGNVELLVQELRILNEAKTPPFYIEEAVDANETLRLKYRYLDLRRSDMQRKMMLRHRVAKLTRDFFDQAGFLEIETPMLTRSTPEGARDYLVPSRVFPGQFFALPQSPQQFKQLLMLAGYDRYMQIVRCFRDEDLRADRQPEFTQIDIEMTFVDPDDVMAINEDFLDSLLTELTGQTIKRPFLRLTYAEAMRRFGSDRPDLRFGMELKDVSYLLAGSEFKVFSGAIESGGCVQMIAVPGGAALSRREIDDLATYIKTYRAKGLAWLALEEPLRGPVARFIDEQTAAALIERADAKTGDLLLFVADERSVVLEALGQLRCEVARRQGLIDPGVLSLLWVTEFPLLEYDEDDQRFYATHHPFTSPMDEDIELLDTKPEYVRAKAYDIVLNGTEIGGGSIRIHDPSLQQKIFSLLGMEQEEAWRRFGYLLEAFQYGAPPHGGIAYGLDRMVMILSGSSSIRDVIAFPKVQTSACLMTGAPNMIDEKQLDELNLSIRSEPSDKGCDEHAT